MNEYGVATKLLENIGATAENFVRVTGRHYLKVPTTATIPLEKPLELDKLREGKAERAREGNVKVLCQINRIPVLGWEMTWQRR